MIHKHWPNAISHSFSPFPCFGVLFFIFKNVSTDTRELNPGTNTIAFQGENTPYAPPPPPPSQNSNKSHNQFSAWPLEVTVWYNFALTRTNVYLKIHTQCASNSNEKNILKQV